MRRLAGLPPIYWWLWLGYLLSSLGTFVFPFLALYLSSRGVDARLTGLVVSLLGVGAVLAGRTWLGLFAGDAVTTILFAGLVLFRVPESRPAPGSEGRALGWTNLLGDRPFLALLATHFTFMIVFLQFQFALPLAVVRSGFGTQEYGRLMALNCAAVFVTQPFTSRWLRSIDRGTLLAIASVCFGLGFGAYSLSFNMPQFYAATLLWTAGDVLGLPLVSAVVASMSPVDLRGRYQGAQMLAQALSMTAAPLVAGAVIDAFGLRTLWAGCIVVGFAAAAAHALLGAARRRRSALAA